MKPIMLFIAVLLCSTSIFAQKKIKGNGNMTSIIRTTADYDAVNFTGSFDYVLVAGAEGTITIEGEDNLLPYIITEVKQNTLTVRTENKIQLQTSKNKTIKITVPFEAISAVTLTGSGDVWNEHTITSPNFKTAIMGSGDVKLTVEASSVEAKVTGSGDLVLKGQTDRLKVNVTGSGDYKGFNLEAQDVDVSVNGSGDAKVTCHGNLKARVSGSGDIKYKGNPKTEDAIVAGSGRIGR